ncbi:MAG: hypothetical protein UX25_C0039G0001, partial [Candidatus Woesebacteria bacterium GW2011_GWC2_45_9]
ERDCRSPTGCFLGAGKIGIRVRMGVKTVHPIKNVGMGLKHSLPKKSRIECFFGVASGKIQSRGKKKEIVRLGLQLLGKDSEVFSVAFRRNFPSPFLFVIGFVADDDVPVGHRPIKGTQKVYPAIYFIRTRFLPSGI